MQCRIYSLISISATSTMKQAYQASEITNDSLRPHLKTKFKHAQRTKNLENSSIATTTTIDSLLLTRFDSTWAMERWAQQRKEMVDIHTDKMVRILTADTTMSAQMMRAIKGDSDMDRAVAV